MLAAANLRFASDGAELRADAVTRHLCAIESALIGLPSYQPGVRLHGVQGLIPLLGATGPIGALVSSHLDTQCQPVRAVLFDKSEATNWSLQWHQDRTIAVAERVDVDGFGPWTIKAGTYHVEPPIEILARMITVRVHLDAVPLANAPLLVAPGSHRMGRIPQANIKYVVERCGTTACIANAGDVWVYATLIVHASEAARAPTRRRVLQVDYASDELPGGLRWLGV